MCTHEDSHAFTLAEVAALPRPVLVAVAERAIASSQNLDGTVARVKAEGGPDAAPHSLLAELARYAVNKGFYSGTAAAHALGLKHY